MNQPNKEQKNILLYIAIGLVSLGLLLPYFNKPTISVDYNQNFAKPTEKTLLDLCDPVIASLKGSGKDGAVLASLYNDLATLIEIDDSIVKNTEEIREANSLSGKMLKLDIQTKYPDFPKSANNLVVTHIGDENAVLSTELRKKSADAFRALAWACNEGSK